MAAQKKSIDEIWKELNANAAPKRQWIRLPPTSSNVGKPVVSVPTSAPKSLQQTHPESDQVLEYRKPFSYYNPELVGVAPVEFQSYVGSMQRSINCLSDPDRSARVQALVSIRDKLLSGDASTPKASPQLLQAVICGPLLYPASQLLKDPAEKARTSCIQLWIGALQQIDDFSVVLPVLVPGILKRIGVLPVQEPAEEVRLQLVQLVELLLSRGAPRSLAGFAQEFCSVLQQAQADSFHLVKKAGSTAICTCCRVLPASALEGKLEKVVQAVVCNLQHGHWRVRCSALQALDALMHHGLPLSCVQSLVVPAIRPMAFDHSSNVRQQLFATVAGWLGHQDLHAGPHANSKPADGQANSTGAGIGQAPVAGTSAGPGQAPPADTIAGTGQEPTAATLGASQVLRITTHAPLLLPILLLGLTDPQASIATATLELVERVGEAYMAAKQAAGEHISSTKGSSLITAATAMKHGSGQEPGAREDKMVVDHTASAAGDHQGCAPTAMEEDSSTHDDSQQPENGDDAVADTANGDLAVAGTPRLGDSRGMSAAQGGMQTDASREKLATVPAWLGPPYQGLRGTACRQMVADWLPELLQLVYADLAEWTAALRLGAARCLHSTLVLAQNAVRPHLPRLLPTLCAVVDDSDADVARRVVLCVHVLGSFTLPQDWLPMLLDMGPGSKGHPELAASWSEAQRANTLVVLSGLLHAASNCGHAIDDQLVMWLGEWLSQQAVCCSEGAAAPPVWRQLLSVVINTLNWLGGRCQLCSTALFGVLLHLSGSQEEVAGAVGKSHCTSVSSALQQLAARCGLPGVEQLAEQHAQALLPSICKDHANWTAQAPSYLTLKALLRVCGSSTLAHLLPPVAELLHSCLTDDERDPNLRVSMLQLVDELAEQPHLAPCFQGPASEAWLSKLLLPCLVWRAGKVAAAVRFAAIAAIATMLSRRLAPANVLLKLIDNGMLPLLFQCLDEDWYSDVRKSSCFVMQQLLEVTGPALSEQHIRTIYPELLKRLDDSNNSVRIAACQALLTLAHGLTPDYCSTNTGYLAAGVIIHMDDADEKVREAACAVLLALAAVKPGELAAEVRKVQEQFRAAHHCTQVLDACRAAGVE